MNDDSYFLAIAQEKALESSCLSRKVGAVVVVRGKILATGYNETSKGQMLCGKGGCNRCIMRVRGEIPSGAMRSDCMCVHAEVNAINGLNDLPIEGADMYINMPPCEECAQAIHEAGISRVIYPKPSHDGRGIAYLKQHHIALVGLDTRNSC